jgi:hypothetical protein
MARKYLLLMGFAVLFAGIVLSLLNISEKIQLNLICGIVIFGVSLLIVQSNRLNPKK